MKLRTVPCPSCGGSGGVTKSPPCDVCGGAGTIIADVGAESDRMQYPIPAPFKRGVYVRKKAGAKWEGYVVSCYQSINGEWHVVVETTCTGVEGAQHLYPASVVKEVE